MSIENLYPYAGDHAVQNAIFTLEWAEPLKVEAIHAAKKLATKFKNVGLPHAAEHQFEFRIETRPIAAGAQSNVPTPTAIIFASSATPGETSRSVTITRNHCLVTVPDYTRWDTVFAEVKKYFKIVFDEIGPSRPISAINLQYYDIFTWRDEPENLNLREVFSQNAYIPESIFEQTGLWHVHQGMLQKHSSPISHDQLDNLNVEFQDVNQQRVIQITGAHRAILRDPLWQVHLKNEPLMHDIFGVLHTKNKTMLHRLLTSTMTDRINLSI